MDTPETNGYDSAPARQPDRPAYDPNNLSPEDEEARKYDDNSEGIDWDEIIATTQNDCEAGIFAYDSGDYPTQAEADAALCALFDSIVEGALRDAASTPSHYASDR